MASSKRKCAHCKTYFKPERSFPGPEAWCSDECGVALAMSRRGKGKAKMERQAPDKKKAARASSKGHQEELTQQAINALARALDEGKPCISCGQYRNLEAGHYRSVGAMPYLRFNLLNIHGQCRSCNVSGTRSYKRGKPASVVSRDYEAGLRARYGDALADWLNGDHPPNHYAIHELKQIRKRANADRRRLERGEPMENVWRNIKNV